MTETVKEPLSENVQETLMDKTSFANVVAALAVIGGIVYAVWKGDLTLIENLAFAGAGYLFGSTVAREK